MADEVLSSDELETLLQTMRSARSDGSENAPASPTAGGAAVPGHPKILPYDFKHPERVSREQMRSLQSLHAGFGRDFGSALSAMLRSAVEVKLTSVDQLTYSEFIFSLENPTCFNLLRAAPLTSKLILDINPSILYPIIDRLLGGGSEPASVARRPLTEIELRLVSRVTSLCLQELRKSWQKVVDLDLAVERVECNPHVAEIAPPNEVVVVVSFELGVGSARGMMNLCLPLPALEQLAGALAADTWAAHQSVRGSRETRGQISAQLDRSVVELVAHLAETKINAGDILNLRVGDIIATEQDIHAPLAICVQGVPKFQAQVGALKGHKAVQIDQRLE